MPHRCRLLPPPPLWGRSARSAGRGTLRAKTVANLKSQRSPQDPLRLAALATSPTRGEGELAAPARRERTAGACGQIRPNAPYAIALPSHEGGLARMSVLS